MFGYKIIKKKQYRRLLQESLDALQQITPLEYKIIDLEAKLDKPRCSKCAKFEKASDPIKEEAKLREESRDHDYEKDVKKLGAQLYDMIEKLNTANDLDISNPTIQNGFEWKGKYDLKLSLSGRKLTGLEVGAAGNSFHQKFRGYYEGTPSYLFGKAF